MEVRRYDINLLDEKRTKLDQQIADFKEAQRKELDRRVAEFKEDRDREYVAYKTALQNACPVSQTGNFEEVVDTGSDERSDKPTRSLERGSDPRSPWSATGETSLSGTADNCNFKNVSMRPKTDPGGTNESASAAKPSQHGRESELQGLFTPGYLPLLDSSTNHEQRRSPKESSLPTISVPGASHLPVSGVPKLSSSATGAPPAVTSPQLHQTRPFSSSAPHSHALQRSDSMRSDTSIASLRSSLKNPSQPRSPKKVLFSIDNTVVSPSSSPVAQRRHTTSSDNLKKLGGGPQLGTEKFEIVKKKKIKKSDKRKLNRVRDDNADDSNGGSSASVPISNFRSSVPIPTPSNGWANAFRNWPSSSASAKATDTSKSSAEDFERVEKDDDVFTFDEDMETPQPKKPEQQSNMIETEDIEEGESTQPLTGSSPHAGSLPIEIKWSARKEGKGGKEFGFDTRDYRE